MKSFRLRKTARLAALKPFGIATFSCFAGFLALGTTFADSGTWLATPVDNNWNNPANWSTGTVPGGNETATMGTSSVTSLVVRLYSFVGTIVFAPGASAYTITFTLPGQTNYFFWFIGGAGVDNESGIVQNFVLPAPVNDLGNGAVVDFYDGTAGTLTNFTCEPNSVTTGGAAGIAFGRASAGAATLHNLGATTPGGFGGVTSFEGGGASAENATIINEGGTVSGALGGQTIFDSYAGGFSTAGNATFIAHGGTNGGGGGGVSLYRNCQGGRARFELFGNGSLDISKANRNFATGSIEGDGQVYLGSQNLSIGSNDLSTTFAGTLHGGSDGIMGSRGLTKIGAGTLTLTGANLYENSTTVTAGILAVSNRIGSGTGTGEIDVTGGTLGGSGTVFGAVIIGTGSNSGATFAPAAGTGQAATFTTRSTLTFQSDSTYDCLLSGRGHKAMSDKAVASGVTIDTGAEFNLTSRVQGRVKKGSSFTVISNTSSTPISGTFSNLADGTTIRVGSHRLQASYEGGDGNDLTLTVLP